MPKKNSWVFAAADRQVAPGWLFVTIQRRDDAWVIHSLDRRPPAQVAKDSPLEPFLVSPDFQRWSNYYADNIGNCDSFAARDTPLKTVCSSALAGKNHKKALAGLLFGGSGVAGQRYDVDRVNQAINTIDPADALQRLELLERMN